MSENIITHVESARSVVTMVKNQIKNETGKYAAYVAENNVTAENVADHVKALRELAYPGVKSSGRAEIGTPEREAKRFADKVRMGLRTAVGDSPAERKGTANLLTSHGVEALADLVAKGANREDLLAAVLEELNTRVK